MGHFYANIKGNRGEATRMGSKSSGMYGNIRGWNIGGYVVMRHNEETGKDTVSIYLTSGSNGGASDKFLGTWEESGYGKEPKLLVEAIDR